MFRLKAMVITLAAVGSLSGPVLAQEAEAPAPAQEEALSPVGTFVDDWGTSFTFALCGEGADLCATLETLEGDSATEENLAYVGSQVVQAVPAGPNTWKGSINAGSLSGETTITQTSADTIDIQGCRAILCQTLTYTRQ